MPTTIILSPSKEMNLSAGSQKVDLSPNTYELYQCIQSLSIENLKKTLKLSEEKAIEVHSYYKKLTDPIAKPAIQTYQGIAYRQIDLNKLNLNYVQHHLWILSAFYGPIRPLDAISPYRLDFQSNLKINNQSLKKFWSKIYTETLQAYTVINLASNEFSSVIHSNVCDVWNVEFYQDLNHRKKAPSATAKKLRGALTHHLLYHENFNLQTFKSFEFEGYQFIHYDSINKEYIYQKKQ